jgi:dTDP-4-amino-4,6-dideoxygalactose transaminase
MAGLETKGIATRQGTHAPVLQGYYAEKYGLQSEQFPNAYIADRLSLTIPLYVQMTETEQIMVFSELQKTNS